VCLIREKRNSRRKSGRKEQEVNEVVRKWAALVVILATMLAAGVAFGEDYGPCYEAYRSSMLTEQQMSFEEFRTLYSDTFCTRGGDGPVGTIEGQALGESR